MLQFIKVKPVAGSATIKINVECDGLPFGQIWKGVDDEFTTDSWKAKPLAGECKTFWSLKPAKDYMATFAIYS